jgi:hypothetical protein
VSTFRPFGQTESALNIIFEQSSRPELVTQIIEDSLLAPQGKKLDLETIWDLTIGERIEALLKIASQSGWSAFAATFNCQNQDCSEKIEIELTVPELIDMQQKSGDERRVIVPLEDKQLALRIPTGQDQLLWLGNSYPDEPTAVLSMFQSLMIEKSSAKSLKDFSTKEIRLINQVLQQADPLVGLEITVQCPYCDEAFPYEVDLEEILLASLKDIQDQLISDIHLLASTYHWTERQIASLPPWRRKKYLALSTKGGL